MHTRLFRSEANIRSVDNSFDFEAHLDAGRPVYFTLLWQRGAAVNLAGLQARKITAAGVSGWSQLIQQHAEDDGEFSAQVGTIQPGEKIEVHFIAMALEMDTPAVAALIIDPTSAGRVVVQIAPASGTGTDNMPRGTTWYRKGAVQL